MASPRDMFLLERTLRDTHGAGEYLTAEVLARIPRVVASRLRDGTRIRATVRGDTYHGYFSSVSPRAVVVADTTVNPRIRQIGYGAVQCTGYYRNGRPYGIWGRSREILDPDGNVLGVHLEIFMMQHEWFRLASERYNSCIPDNIALFHTRCIEQNNRFLALDVAAPTNEPAGASGDDSDDNDLISVSNVRVE